MSFHYIPILKWKRGEQQALQNLGPSDKSSARPLVEILPESLDEDDPEASYDKLVKQLDKSWGRQSPIFLELGLLESATPHPVSEILARARAAGLLATPVTGLGRDPEFQAAVAAVAAADDRGLLIRVTPDDIAEVTFAQDLESLLKTLKISASKVDVLIDAGFITTTPQMSVSSQAFMVAGFVSMVLGLQPWRSCTYAASAFPESLASISGAGTLPRTEWEVWKSVAARLGGLRRVLFGDYAVAHAIYNPVSFPGAANIRYTIDGQWLIQRGRKVTGPLYGGFGQYVTLAQTLVASKSFSGAAFSWGDKYIQDCAAGQVGTGNMTTWRAVATSHHITFVLRQLASSTAASASP